MAQSVPAGNQTYHHGDLRTALVDAASQRIEREGITALSLRKLADDIGVSRSALYHHFRDKNALLNAVAARGFDQWLSKTQNRDNAQIIASPDRLKQFVHGYVRWAIAHPQLYDIMFGRPIWKHKLADEELKDIAFPAFQYMLKLISDWQEQGLLLQEESALRQTQVIWATLHGLAKLIIDGVYDDSAHIDEMCNCVATMLLSQHSETKN